MRKGGSGLSSLAKMQQQQQGEPQGGDQRPTERKRLVLTSTKVKSSSRDTGGTGMGAAYNRSVAAGPDGTRGFAMRRTKLQKFGTPRAGEAGEPRSYFVCLLRPVITVLTVAALLFRAAAINPLSFSSGPAPGGGGGGRGMPRPAAQQDQHGLRNAFVRDVWNDGEEQHEDRIVQNESELADDWENDVETTPEKARAAARGSHMGGGGGFGQGAQAVFGAAANEHLQMFERVLSAGASNGQVDEQDARKLIATLQMLATRNQIHEPTMCHAVAAALSLPKAAGLPMDFHGHALRAACPIVVRLASIDGLDQRVADGLASAMQLWSTDGEMWNGVPLFTVHLRIMIKAAQSLLRGPGRSAFRRRFMVASVTESLKQIPSEAITGMRLVRSLLEDFVGICHAGAYAQVVAPQLPEDLAEGMQVAKAQDQDEEACSDSEEEEQDEADNEPTAEDDQRTFSMQLPEKDLVVEQTALKPEDAVLLWYLSSLAEADCQRFFKRSTERPQMKDLIAEGGIKSEVAVLEADSLLLRLLSEYGVDFDTAGGGQMLHFVYVLEKLLQDFVSRGCLIQVVFFDVHTALWGDNWRYLLARRVMLGHIQSMHSTGKLPLPALQFPAWHADTRDGAAGNNGWDQYLAETRPSLVFLDRRWLALRLMHMQCARQNIAVVPLNTIHSFSSGGGEISALIFGKWRARDSNRGMESFAGSRYMDVLASWSYRATPIEEGADRLATVREFEQRQGGVMQLLVGACAETLRGASEEDLSEVSLLCQLHMVCVVMQATLALEWRVQSVRLLDSGVMASVTQYVRNWCANAVNLSTLIDEIEEHETSDLVFPEYYEKNVQDVSDACQEIDVEFSDILDSRLLSCIINFAAVHMARDSGSSGFETALKLPKESIETLKQLWDEVMEWAGPDRARPWNQTGMVRFSGPIFLLQRLISH